jgi:hypothetical protein
VVSLSVHFDVKRQIRFPGIQLRPSTLLLRTPLTFILLSFRRIVFLVRIPIVAAMFRHAVRRSVLVARPAISSPLAISLPRRPVRCQSSAIAARTAAASALSVSRRLYSSSAAEGPQTEVYPADPSTETEAEASEKSIPGEDGPITRFRDLSKLGVNETLIRAIAEGMGYETMTEVQAMTINAALEGKDMCAEALSS